MAAALARGPRPPLAQRSARSSLSGRHADGEPREVASVAVQLQPPLGPGVAERMPGARSASSMDAAGLRLLAPSPAGVAIRRGSVDVAALEGAQKTCVCAVCAVCAVGGGRGFVGHSPSFLGCGCFWKWFVGDTCDVRPPACCCRTHAALLRVAPQGPAQFLVWESIYLPIVALPACEYSSCVCESLCR